MMVPFLSQLNSISLLLPLSDDIPYDDGSAYEYAIAIQERLKRANEEFQKDPTPVELKHPPRVSFGTVVRAIDIIIDPNEHDTSDFLFRASITSVQEEPLEIARSPRSDTSTHEYTIPLNDIQPKGGLSLLEKIKELQFYSSIPTEEQRWATNANNDSTASHRDGRFPILSSSFIASLSIA